jgi:hypothetical protein
MKERWETYEDDRGKKQGRPSGVFEMSGYKGAIDKVQTVIELWRDDLEDPNPNTGRMIKFNAQIMKSRHNADAIGNKFEDDNITVADIGTAIVSGSKRKDWE